MLEFPGLTRNSTLMEMRSSSTGFHLSRATLVAFGLLAGPPASLIMALLGRVLAPESRAFGVGIHYMMFYAGLALLPPVAGWVRDVTGAPAAPIMAAVGFLGMALGCLAALGGLSRRASPDAAAEARPGR